jgi:nitrile hydratase
MDGIHDLGGMHGFGPVDREENEPPFHGRWEAAVVALMRAGRAAGVYNIDEFRHGIERMVPATYLGSTYFERWLDGITRLFVEKGVVSADEVAAWTTRFAERPDTALPAAAPAPTWRSHEAPEPVSSFREPSAPPRFVVGAVVLTRETHPTGHTRLPRYARGKRGVIAAHRGCHVFPDTNAHRRGEAPQHVYGVRFDARELWADAAERNAPVYLDLWESYLLPA